MPDDLDKTAPEDPKTFNKNQSWEWDDLVDEIAEENPDWDEDDIRAQIERSLEDPRYHHQKTRKKLKELVLIFLGLKYSLKR